MEQGLHYIEQVERIREIFEREIKGFPVAHCSDAARVVHILTGLQEVGGIRVGYDIFNACNYDPGRKLYVDITADQFPNCSEKVSVFNDFFVFSQREYFTEIQRTCHSEKMRSLVGRVIEVARRDDILQFSNYVYLSKH